MLALLQLHPQNRISNLNSGPGRNRTPLRSSRTDQTNFRRTRSLLSSFILRHCQACKLKFRLRELISCFYCTQTNNSASKSRQRRAEAEHKHEVSSLNLNLSLQAWPLQMGPPFKCGGCRDRKWRARPWPQQCTRSCVNSLFGTYY